MIGINLPSVASHQSSRLFNNALKHAHEWTTSRRSAEVEALDLDEKGYVRSLPEGVELVSYFGGDDIAYSRDEEWVFTWEGEGDVRVGGAKVISAEPHRIVFTYARAVSIVVSSVNPANYPRNMRVTETSLEHSKEEFFKPYIRKIRDFKFDFIRFMDLMRTNDSEVKTWDDYPAEGAYTYKPHVPIAVLCRLANKLQADAWFCVPHQTDARFVEKMAEVIKNTLDPKRRVYVEHSNECWNFIFSQAKYCLNKGIELGFTQPPVPRGNTTIGMNRYHLSRTVECGNIVKSICDEHKVITVLGGRKGKNAGKMYLHFDPELAKQVDVYACAPYFGHQLGGDNSAPEVREWTLDELFSELDRIVDENALLMQQTKDSVAEFGLPLIAYEGGQHLVGVRKWAHDEKLTALFIAANRDPRMGELYTRYLNNWKNIVGNQFAIFTFMHHPSAVGSWGIFENFTQKDTPKSKAVRDFMQA